MPEDRVRLGEPVSTEQAVRAVLRCIDSAIVGSIDADSSPRHTFDRLKKTDRDAGAAPYDLLSSGEKKLVDIAFALWRGPIPDGACLNALGGLDRDTRRTVLIILWYFYLGRDLSEIEVGTLEWASLFDPPRRRVDVDTRGRT